MYLHLTTLLIASFFSLGISQDEPIELIPVDAGTEDRGSISGSLKVVRTNLQQNQSFEQLFRVAGSKDIYIRKAGGLQAVFRNPVYFGSGDDAIPLVPVGTIYCIGGVRPELLKQLGQLQNDEDDFEEWTQKDIPIKRRRQAQQAKTSVVSHSKTIQFIDNESYRRKRLASFVLDIILVQ